jgi:prepilin-type processing-associated H-X9-DG protein
MESSRPDRIEKGDLAMHVECPRCQHTQEMPGHLAGQVVTCPSCGQEFRMPALADEPPPLSVRTAKENDRGATTSLVLAILALVLCLGPLLAIPAVIIGHRSLGRIRRSRGVLGGEGLAVAGLVTGYAGMIVFAVFLIPLAGVLAAILIPVMMDAHDADLRAACQNNLKQHGYICTQHAAENKGVYPPVSAEPGRLMYAVEAPEGSSDVYPEYFWDLNIFYCPGDTDTPAGTPEVDIDDHSYFYLSHTLLGDEDAEILADAYLAAVARGETLAGEIELAPGQGSTKESRLLQIRDGVERYITPDHISGPAETSYLLSRVPLMIERLGNHRPEGGNVLYLDGRVEFIEYPGKFPMTERTIAALERMDQAQAP